MIIYATWSLYYLWLDQVGYLDTLDGELMDNSSDFFTIIYVCLIAPVAEETVFRGWLVKLLKRYGSLVAITFSALSFGLFHGTVTQSVPAVIIGVVFAVIVLRFDSYVPTIILHIINNALSFFPQYEQLLNPKLVMAAAAAGIIIFISSNLKAILKSLKQIKLIIQLSWRSVSYIVFCIAYIAIILLDFFGILYI